MARIVTFELIIQCSWDDFDYETYIYIKHSICYLYQITIINIINEWKKGENAMMR